MLAVRCHRPPSLCRTHPLAPRKQPLLQCASSRACTEGGHSALHQALTPHTLPPGVPAGMHASNTPPRSRHAHCTDHPPRCESLRRHRPISAAPSLPRRRHARGNQPEYAVSGSRDAGRDCFAGGGGDHTIRRHPLAEGLRARPAGPPGTGSGKRHDGTPLQRSVTCVAGEGGKGSPLGLRCPPAQEGSALRGCVLLRSCHTVVCAEGEALAGQRRCVENNSAPLGHAHQMLERAPDAPLQTHTAPLLLLLHLRCHLHLGSRPSRKGLPLSLPPP